MMLYVVAYDIPCNQRRKKMADLLEGYGRRVQFSVFECVLPPKKYVELQARLRARVELERVELEEDSVRFYPLSGHTLGQVVVWGEPPLMLMPGSTIV